MITTTPSHIRKRSTRSATAGFSLVEIMIGATLSALILAGTMSTFLFLGRSGANIQNYSDMESQARKALEIFAEDARQASAITWTSDTQITLTVNSANVVYTYSNANRTFSRVDATSNRVLISGITSGTFLFRGYNLSGVLLPVTTAAELAAAGTNTKQLQISLQASRTNQTVVAATNTVLSARFILRNKIVTA
ncbi:PilW family protein [Horticoccus sp. 23ND18S-11]|uniref:PilW family protein n=1 Tax=Horticoccus sp. 23ND18S-11 TaxID=3391832 RepID=UPI0039C9653B